MNQHLELALNLAIERDTKQTDAERRNAEEASKVKAMLLSSQQQLTKMLTDTFRDVKLKGGAQLVVQDPTVPSPNAREIKIVSVTGSLVHPFVTVHTRCHSSDSKITYSAAVFNSDNGKHTLGPWTTHGSQHAADTDTLMQYISHHLSKYIDIDWVRRAHIKFTSRQVSLLEWVLSLGHDRISERPETLGWRQEELDAIEHMLSAVYG